MIQGGRTNLAPATVAVPREGFLSAWKWCGLTACAAGSSATTTVLSDGCPCPDIIGNRQGQDGSRGMVKMKGERHIIHTATPKISAKVNQ